MYADAASTSFVSPVDEVDTNCIPPTDNTSAPVTFTGEPCDVSISTVSDNASQGDEKDAGCVPPTDNMSAPVTLPASHSYNGIRHRVCGNFFCKTLDLKIRSIQKYFETNFGVLSIGSVTDKRSKHTPSNKTPEWKRDLIRKHIESYPVVESHYCRASSSRK